MRPFAVLILITLCCSQSFHAWADANSDIRESDSACAESRVLPRKLYFTSFSAYAEITLSCTDLPNGQVREDIRILENGYFNVFRGPTNWANGVSNPQPTGSMTSSRDPDSKLARGKITVVIPARTEGGRTSPYSYRYILSWIERSEWSLEVGLGPDKIAIESAFVETITNGHVVETHNVRRRQIAFHTTFNGRNSPVHITPSKDLGPLAAGLCDQARKQGFVKKLRGSNEEHNFLGYDGDFSLQLFPANGNVTRARCFADFEGYSSEFTKGVVRFFVDSAPMWKFENDTYITEEYFDDEVDQTFPSILRDGQIVGVDVKEVDPRGRLTWLKLDADPWGINPVYGEVNLKGRCARVALAQTLKRVVDQRTFELERSNHNQPLFLKPKVANKFKVHGTIYRDEFCKVRADDIYLSYGGSVPPGTELTNADTIRYIKGQGSVNRIALEPLNPDWGPFAQWPTTDTFVYY
jgi:hypothetical protein